MKKITMIIEKHPDGYVACPVGIKRVVVGEGDSQEEVLADVKSAIRFHLETLGPRGAGRGGAGAGSLRGRSDGLTRGEVPGRRPQGAGAPGAANTGLRVGARGSTPCFAAPEYRWGGYPADGVSLALPQAMVHAGLPPPVALDPNGTATQAQEVLSEHTSPQTSPSRRSGFAARRLESQAAGGDGWTIRVVIHAVVRSLQAGRPAS